MDDNELYDKASAVHSALSLAEGLLCEMISPLEADEPPVTLPGVLSADERLNALRCTLLDIRAANLQLVMCVLIDLQSRRKENPA